jgi:uncharacterized protein (TIGR02271 family)
MTSIANPEQLIGRTAVDATGDKIGKIKQVYLDDQTNEPAWVTVNTGLFGNKESFAPLQGAQEEGDSLRLAVEKSQVKDAPQVADDGHIEDSEQQALYEYYSRFLHGGRTTGSETTGVAETRGETAETAETTGTAGTTGGVTTGRGPEGRDLSGPTTDEAMTRSEEQLHVGKEQVETGRARLRKYVVTENVTQTVPVQREEVRVEREPITDANRGAATDGPAISEEEHEVTLHEERPVVQKEAVPVERVRLGTETVTDQREVNEEVRKEQIDTDGVEGTGGTTR